MMDSEAYEGSSIGLLDFHSESMLKLDGVQKRWGASANACVPLHHPASVAILLGCVTSAGQ